MSGDLYWDSVALALHMDDVGLTDVKGHGMTLAGGVSRSAVQSKFGGFSAHFDGVDGELHNSVIMGEIDVESFALQLWCRPTAQGQVNPCVVSLQALQIEYKPTGFADGFVISIDGVRTACGAYAEDAWHYIWIARSASTTTVYINGIFIATLASAFEYGDTLYIGSNNLGTNPDSAFTGYIDDVLFTSGVYRTDYSVPVAAFPEGLPDPEADGLGAILFTGAAVGIVSPVGAGLGTLRLNGAAVGEVHDTGRGIGRLSFAGSAAGLTGRAGSASGTMRFTGAAVGRHGRFGAAAGRLRFTGEAVGKHGITGVCAGALVITGAAVGSTPLHPFGRVAGSVKFTGYAVGQIPQPADACA